MNIICHIEQLLRVHDCVVVPGFGAFVASATHAVPAADSLTISAPRRSVMFNPELNHNDGLLAASIVRRDGLTFEMAMQRITDEVSLTHAMLRTTGFMKFGSLGEFRLNHDFLDFVPVQSDNSAANPWSFLPPLPLLTIQQAQEKEPTVIVASPDKFYVPVSRNIFRVAASLAVIVALGLMLLSIPVNIDSSTVFASVFRGFGQSSEVADVHDAQALLTDAADSLFPYAEADFSSSAECEILIAVGTENAGSETSEIPAPIVVNPYRVIVASLATKALAEKYITEHDDPAMRVHDSGEGRHRVYVAEANTLQEALAIAESPEMTTRYGDGVWVSRH
ncbi:MAG: hypothetical protein K2M04_04005 [Muribaculaceae bacterium]|nr:hypothetical protein [Muribaculaceae bacterium]